MATPDVSMHVEEVVVVTTPDTATDSSNMEDVKTVLVTTDLTHSSDGLTEEENFETENAAAEFTSSTELKDCMIEVKVAEEEDSTEPEILYPITCGESKASLIWRKFVCPGINVKCVQFHDSIISPKEFVHLSGKSTLKDWKRAIRMNGVMLRRIMDSGELDFYQHNKVCSNTCRSTKIDLSGARASLGSQQSTEYIPITPATTDLNGSPATITIEACEESSDWTVTIAEDTFAFWQGLRDAGLLEDVIQETQQEIIEIAKGLQERVKQPPLQLCDAVFLNNVVQNFGMLDLIKKVLASHKCQMDRSREQYTRDLAALEKQCDEHRNRAKELKHKSQHLNNVLMTLTPHVAPPPVKRPRLMRAASGPVAVTSHTSSQSAPITLGHGLSLGQLASLPLGKVISTVPASALGKSSLQPAAMSNNGSPVIGGYTVLTSPSSSFPNAVEIHPDSANLTVLSAAAIQDGSTIVKVMSPLQFLTLPGLQTTIHNVAQVTPSGNTIVTLPSDAVEAAATAEEHTTIEVASLTEEHEQK